MPLMVTVVQYSTVQYSTVAFVVDIHCRRCGVALFVYSSLGPTQVLGRGPFRLAYGPSCGHIVFCELAVSVVD